MKERLNTTLALVRNILESDDLARNSDNHLYLKVLETVAKSKGVAIDLDNVSIVDFLAHMDLLGFPPFESVRRARQKNQAKYPWLAASDEVALFRGENEEAYREFAVS